MQNPTNLSCNRATGLAAAIPRPHCIAGAVLFPIDYVYNFVPKTLGTCCSVHLGTCLMTHHPWSSYSFRHEATPTSSLRSKSTGRRRVCLVPGPLPQRSCCSWHGPGCWVGTGGQCCSVQLPPCISRLLGNTELDLSAAITNPYSAEAKWKGKRDVAMFGQKKCMAKLGAQIRVYQFSYLLKVYRVDYFKETK